MRINPLLLCLIHNKCVCDDKYSHADTHTHTQPDLLLFITFTVFFFFVLLA